MLPDLAYYLHAPYLTEWRRHEGDYRDDITALVIFLPAVVEALEAGGPKP